MKLAFITLVLIANSAFASTDIIESMKGLYSSLDKDCTYDLAEIRVTKSKGDRIFRVKLSHTKTGSFNLHSLNLENLWTKVKTTRGLKRIIRQDRLQGNSLISEEKECMLGWVGCSDYNQTEVVTLINDEILEAKFESSGTFCSYRRIP